MKVYPHCEGGRRGRSREGEGPVIVYTHCEVRGRGRRGGEVGWGERGVWWYIQIVRWVGRGRGEEGRGRGERGGEGGEER